MSEDDTDRAAVVYSASHNVVSVRSEADPLTGWWRREDWRGDRRYAGMIVNTVADLQERWRGDASLPDLELISNDNGFLETTDGHFQQRTLLAR